VHVIYTDAIDTLFKHRFQENLYYKAEVVDDPDVNKAFKSQDLATKGNIHKLRSP